MHQPITILALNAARSVPLVHGVQPSAQAAVWYKHVHEMWKVFLDSLRALSAFVAGHHQISGVLYSVPSGSKRTLSEQ